eukprot:9012129-Pyramimonas_sp.AAC.1
MCIRDRGGPAPRNLGASARDAQGAASENAEARPLASSIVSPWTRTLPLNFGNSGTCSACVTEDNSRMLAK